MPDRPYLFLELTNALCHVCLRKVEAKVIVQEERVYLLKHCPEHGRQKVLISTDAEYYALCRRFLKPSQMPLKFNTPVRYGCPYDCGLCTDHEQHSCLTLVEVTDRCNLTCPVCYAESSPERLPHRPLEQIEFMLDAIVRNEGQPDVVQISGGEPTIHPEFFRILELAKQRPIRHLMVNTNGLRIAQDADFTRRLAEFMPGFEVYLQFDSLQPGPLQMLRGVDLSEVRRRAVDRLNEHGISTNLVVTLARGVNDDEIGAIIDYALAQPAVRGITFQPIQMAGRVEGFDPERDRLTLAEVRRRILDQHALFSPADIVPVPCHPDCLAMAYALKLGDRTVPLTGMIDPQVLLHGEGNTILYEKNDAVRDEMIRLFSTAASPGSSALSLRQLLCCLPQIELPGQITYENVFRITIMQFMDAWNMDIRSVKKTCVHIAHPDGRIIPFDTYNLFYRDGREERLAEIRATLPGSVVTGLTVGETGSARS